jgi:uncharacterized protein YuzE
MLKNFKPNSNYIITLILVTFTHIIVLTYVKYSSRLNWNQTALNQSQFFNKLRVDKIDLINQDELEKIKRVGIKGGKKGTYNPDILNPKGSNMPLDFKNLGFDSIGAPQPAPAQKKVAANSQPSPLAPTSETETNASGIYFNPKKEKYIRPNREHEAIKNETVKNLGIDKINSKASNISNFDIRIERPEGVPEDQLNADEKAFYSFYKRTYSNYVSKLFAAYNKIRIDRPGLDLAFNDQHILVGKIDYDENGNIITIKILKSSESDDVHYFFEEALKSLNIPNPPKIFVKKQKQFSVYYQIHIN